MACPDLPVTPASELGLREPKTPAFLVEALWATQAVGIVGGEPKCGKSFLALHIAVAVASGTPCLGRYKVESPGPVLLYPAEDSHTIVRARLDGISRSAGTTIEALPLGVITAPSLRLDTVSDRDRLAHTVASHRPALLVLDPFVRLHRVDENSSGDVATLLDYLRQLQRTFSVAILVVHHARKGGRGLRPGQALRGSSEFHAWGDSNLYLSRRHDQIRLTVEHRGAPSLEGLALELTSRENLGPHLALCPPLDREDARPPDPLARVLHALATFGRPASRTQLRERCRMKTSSLSTALAELLATARIRQDRDGRYQLAC